MLMQAFNFVFGQCNVALLFIIYRMSSKTCFVSFERLELESESRVVSICMRYRADAKREAGSGKRVIRMDLNGNYDSSSK